MTGSEYTAMAMRTNDGKATERLFRVICKTPATEVKDVGGVLDACLGLTGEAGETVDIIKKWIFQEKPLDLVHLQKEISDTMWYIALMCYSFGFNLDEIMQMNIDKLRARYPNCFDPQRSNKRAENDI